MANEFIISKLLQPHVLPPLPPFPEVESPAITEAGGIDAKTIQAATGDKIETTIFGTPQVVPIFIKLKSENTWWKFPVEPLLNIDGKNNLIKRNVAKKKEGFGSIKEYWTQDDWVINVQGLLTTTDSEEFPWDDYHTLKKYITAKKVLEIKCKPLNELGVSFIVIETYSLPFTKGPENQNFSFTALSDTEWNLLIKKDANVL